MQTFGTCTQKLIRSFDCQEGVGVWRILKIPDAKVFVSAIAALLCCVLMSSALAQSEDKTGTANKNWFDRWHAFGDKFVTGSAERIDGFFANSERATFEQNNTYVRLRADADYVEGTSWEVGVGLKLSLKLPGLGDRVRLVMNDDDADDDDLSKGGNSAKESTIGFRFIGKQLKNFGFSVDLGLRINDGDLAAYTQLNLGKKYSLGEKWRGRTTNRLYYYGDTGVRNDFRQYFERPIKPNKVLFRSRSRIQYFEENEANPTWEQKFSLFHQLSHKHALVYEASVGNVIADDSPYDPDQILVTPSEDYYRGVLKIRYRRNIWRPWIFMEFWPVVAWPEERDYARVTGVRLRLETYFGSIKKNAHTLSE